MDSEQHTYRYSPLGWAIWLYGPMFVCFGMVIVYLWITNMLHGAENSGTAMHGPVDLFTFITHLGCIDRCQTIDYVFGGMLVFGFPLFAIVLIGIGLLMMNSDRYTAVSSGMLRIHRGAFLHWGRRTVFASEISAITVEDVPIIAVFGGRATRMGTRWNVGVVLKGPEEKKLKRIIVAICPVQEAAQQVRSAIQSQLQ